MNGSVPSVELKRGKFHIKVSHESISETAECNIICAMFLEARNMLRATRPDVTSVKKCNRISVVLYWLGDGLYLSAYKEKDVTVGP
jgi:hypothetical protein